MINKDPLQNFLDCQTQCERISRQVAEDLKQCRSESRMTCRQIATSTGVGELTVRRIEDIGNGRIDSLVKIAFAMGKAVRIQIVDLEQDTIDELSQV